MPGKKITRSIQIGGMTCYVEGDTEEEVARDEEYAKAFAARHHEDPSEMNRFMDAFNAVMVLSKDIDKAIGGCIFDVVPDKSK